MSPNEVIGLGYLGSRIEEDFPLWSGEWSNELKWISFCQRRHSGRGYVIAHLLNGFQLGPNYLSHRLRGQKLIVSDLRENEMARRAGTLRPLSASAAGFAPSPLLTPGFAANVTGYQRVDDLEVRARFEKGWGVPLPSSKGLIPEARILRRAGSLLQRHCCGEWEARTTGVRWRLRSTS